MEMHISNNISLGQAQARTSVTPPTSQKITEIATKNAAKLRARTKRMNFALVTSQVVVVAFILTIIAVSYRPPVEATQAGGSVNQSSVLEQTAPTVDQIAAADVAASVAQSTNMLVSANVASLSISLNSKTDLAQTDNGFISKPQILSQTTGRKGTTTYVTKGGDTVQSIAAEFGVSEDTIRWANNLTSDSLSAGKNLIIPSITGIVYTVKSGDSADSIAQKYQADKNRIITFNDAEISGLQPGQQIIVPEGVLPENERPGYVAPSNSYRSTVASSTNVSATSLSSSVASGNGYAYGYCTYYAYNRRAEIGRPIGGNWGNAVSWASMAAAAGFRVDRTPEAGAVIHNGGGWGGYGHVGVVEKVNSDGSLLVSDMNYVGWNVISTRTVPASSVANYNYIH